MARQCGRPLRADLAEIWRDKRARVWLRIMRISLGWVDLHRHSGRKTEKSVKKTTIFDVLGPGCPMLADCSAFGPIRPKFYVVNRLGYGYKQCEFHQAGSRYAGAAAKKRVNKSQKLTIFAGFSQGCLTARPIARPPEARPGRNFT